jgi:hypothetical protein
MGGGDGWRDNCASDKHTHKRSAEIMLRVLNDMRMYTRACSAGQGRGKEILRGRGKKFEPGLGAGIFRCIFEFPPTPRLFNSKCRVVVFGVVGALGKRKRRGVWIVVSIVIFFVPSSWPW